MKGGFLKWNMVLSQLVFLAVDWMGPPATVIYKRLASLLAEKHAQSCAEFLPAEIILHMHSWISFLN